MRERKQRDKIDLSDHLDFVLEQEESLSDAPSKEEPEPKPKRKYKKRDPSLLKKYRPVNQKMDENGNPIPVRKYKKKATPVQATTADPGEMAELAKEWPDSENDYLKQARLSEDGGYIDSIDARCPLTRIETSIRDTSQVCGLALSPDHSFLATFCSAGSVCIWDTDTFEKLQCLTDDKVCLWSVDSKRIVVGGKLKDRNRWSENDDDNHIMPCPLKVFDIVSAQVLYKFHGHEEEVLSIKGTKYKGETYLLSSSQDGYIIKYHTNDQFDHLYSQTKITDGLTCMAFTLSVLPQTGSRYFIASCDDSIRLYDLESGQIVQSFPGINSCYCDFSQIIECADLDNSGTWEDSEQIYCYVISRGVEVLDAEENTVNSIPNSVKLHKLIYPSKSGENFQLEMVYKYEHPEYNSNSWGVKLASNGRYLAAPTYDGNVFLFHIKTGKVAGILRDHKEIEMRDVVFHPRKRLLFTSADGIGDLI